MSNKCELENAPSCSAQLSGTRHGWLRTAEQFIRSGQPARQVEVGSAPLQHGVHVAAQGVRCICDESHNVAVPSLQCRLQQLRRRRSQRTRDPSQQRLKQRGVIISTRNACKCDNSFRLGLYTCTRLTQ